MESYYFDNKRTPQLASLIKELSLVDGLPFTLDQNFKQDAVINQFFLDLVIPQSPSPRTWKTYAEQLSMFFRFLESFNKTWRDATHDDLKAYYRTRRVGEGANKISARSWNVSMAAVKRFYEWAHRKNYVQNIPFDYKEIRSDYSERSPGQKVITIDLKDKERKKDIKFMTELDFNERFLPQVTNTLEGMRNALFVRLLMRSGLRADEAVTIKLEMLPDPDNPSYVGRKTCPVTITGKGNKARTVRVPKSWLRDAQRYVQWDRADAVEKWKSTNSERNPLKDGDKGYLFLTSTGEPVTYSAMYKMMRKAGERAKFDFKSHPHMLRHSYAIYQLSAMIKAVIEPKRIKDSSTAEAYRRMCHDPLRKLQKLMGHANITTTFIYLDYLDDEDGISDVTADEELFGSEDGYDEIRTADVTEK